MSPLAIKYFMALSAFYPLDTSQSHSDSGIVNLPCYTIAGIYIYMCLPRHLMVVRCGAITSLRLPMQPLVRPCKSHLHILRQISGATSGTAVSILLAELGLMCLPDQWLLRAATFWNALAALPPTSIYQRMALDASAWAKGVSSAIRRTGYHLPISQGDMIHIDVHVLSAHLRQRRYAIWKNLDICPRTCPTRDSRMCTYEVWAARSADCNARSLLDLPLSVRCMHRFLRFEMGCHKLARDTGCLLGMPRQTQSI